MFSLNNRFFIFFSFKLNLFSGDIEEELSWLYTACRTRLKTHLSLSFLSAYAVYVEKYEKFKYFNYFLQASLFRAYFYFHGYVDKLSSRRIQICSRYDVVLLSSRISLLFTFLLNCLLFHILFDSKKIFAFPKCSSLTAIHINCERT